MAFLRSARRLLWCASVLSAGAAFAQDLGLDLSEDSDFRPTAAFLGTAAVDTLPEGTWMSLKMDRVLKGAQRAVESSGLFARVQNSADAFDVLGEFYSQSFSCTQVACLDELARKMKVQTVLFGQLLQRENRVLLRVIAYSRFQDGPRVLDVWAVNNSRLFERKVRDAFLSLSRQSWVPMGVLKVQSSTPSARALLDEGNLGALPIEERIPSGKHRLTVSAEGFLDDVLDIELEAEKTLEFEANLVPRMAEGPGALAEEAYVEESFEDSRRRWPRVFRKPGFYLALAGVASMAAGAAFGFSAKQMAARAKDTDGDGTLDVTRRQALAAQQDALWANVLIGAGGAATTGGLLWLWLQPTTYRATGVTVGLSGRFP